MLKSGGANNSCFSARQNWPTLPIVRMAMQFCYTPCILPGSAQGLTDSGSYLTMLGRFNNRLARNPNQPDPAASLVHIG
jgi:hypothetical protein